MFHLPNRQSTLVKLKDESAATNVNTLSNENLKDVWNSINHETEHEISSDTNLEEIDYPESPFPSLIASLTKAHICYPILFLLYCIYRIVLITDQVYQASQHIVTKMTSACLTTQSTSSYFASAPHTLAMTINKLNSQILQNTINDILQLLMRSIDLLQAILSWIISAMHAYIQCILTFVLTVATATANIVLQSVVQSVNEALQSIQSALNTFVGLVNSMDSALRNNFVYSGWNLNWDQYIPNINTNMQFDVPVVDQLLNATPPDPALWQQNLDLAISKPFTDMKNQLAGVLNQSFMINTSNIWPNPPDLVQLEFCRSFESQQTTLIYNASNILKSLFIGIIVALVLMILGIWIFQARKIHWQWQVTQTAVKKIQHLSLKTVKKENQKETPISVATSEMSLGCQDALAQVRSASSYRVIKFLSSPRLFGHLSHRIRWFLNYVNHPPSLGMIFIGGVGLLIIFCQIQLLNYLQICYISIVAKSIDSWHLAAMTATNTSVVLASTNFANGVNSASDIVQTSVKQNLFQNLKTGATAVNSTINLAVTEMITGLRNVLPNGTFSDQITQTIACLANLQLKSIQSLLTFLSQLSIQLPKVPLDCLSNLNSILFDDIFRTIRYLLIGKPTGQTNSDGSVQYSGGELGALIQLYKDQLNRGVFFHALLLVFGLTTIVQGLMAVVWFSFSSHRKGENFLYILPFRSGFTWAKSWLVKNFQNGSKLTNLTKRTESTVRILKSQTLIENANIQHNHVAMSNIPNLRTVNDEQSIRQLAAITNEQIYKEKPDHDNLSKTERVFIH